MELQFDPTAVGGMINSLIVNICTAILFFLFIWLFRKRPKIKMNAKILIGTDPPFGAIDGEDYSVARNFPCTIELSFVNDSNYNAYSFLPYKLVYSYKNLIDLKSIVINKILGNETKNAKLSFEVFKHHLSVSDLSLAQVYIEPHVKTKFILYVKFENDDGRTFKKKLMVDCL